MLKNFFDTLCFCNAKNNALINNNINVTMNTDTNKIISNKKEKKKDNNFLSCENNNDKNNISTEITNESKKAKNQEIKPKINNTSNEKKEEKGHINNNSPDTKNQLSTKISEDKKLEFQSIKLLNSKKENKEFENYQKTINDIIYSNLDNKSESADDSSENI